MEIVYFGGRGKVLRGDDFTRGQALMLDHRPWCADCRPPEKTPIVPNPASAEARRQGFSAKHPRIVVGTGRHRAIKAPPRKAQFVGIGVAALAVIVAGMAVTSSLSPPPVERVPRQSGADPTPHVPDNVDAQRALRELESFASLAPPDKILARCEERQSKVRGTPQEKRFREIETGAREQKKQRDNEAQFAKELEAPRTAIETDSRFVRYDEIVRRLRALRGIAGSRNSEVDRRLADYQRGRQEWPHGKHAGPFEADEAGFLRNWLVRGVFSNDRDQGMDTDYLKPESTRDPVEGLLVGEVKGSAQASPDRRIDFFRVTHLAIKKPRDGVIAYAACLVQVPENTAADLRMGSDDGAYVWVDGNLVVKAHKPRALEIDKDRATVPLGRGVHRLLMKEDNHAVGFEFALRLLTEEGRPIPGLRVWN